MPRPPNELRRLEEEERRRARAHRRLRWRRRFLLGAWIFGGIALLAVLAFILRLAAYPGG